MYSDAHNHIPPVNGTVMIHPKQTLYTLLAVFVVCLTVNFSLGAQTPAAVYAYIEKYKEVALQNEKEFGIPASITLAQGILESRSGTSPLTRASNNHFGIKAGSKWKGRVHLAQDDEVQKSRFRCYESAAESYRDHARILTTLACYKPLFNINIYNYRAWAHGLKQAGYASAPNYAQALIGLIDHYKLYAINGGAKLRPGKTVYITQYKTVEKEVIEEDEIIPDDEVTEEEAALEEAIQKYVVAINDIHCTIIQPGETLNNIARKYDISLAKLVEFNELGSEKDAKEGDVIFLDKKKKKFTGSRDIYTAKGGESLHEVSQQFGIQIHQLARMNKISEYALLKKGEQIALK